MTLDLGIIVQQGSGWHPEFGNTSKHSGFDKHGDWKNHIMGPWFEDEIDTFNQVNQTGRPSLTTKTYPK
jgi:hypothetical protein